MKWGLRIFATGCLVIGCLIFLMIIDADAAATYPVSSFGPGLYGNTTACGQTLTPSTNLVAHRWLSCGRQLTVCYRRRCVHTVVGDRGPFVGGREFDLSAGLTFRLCSCSPMEWGVRHVRVVSR